MDRLKVAIIFGGSSEEHPISVKSATEVAKNLDLERYEPLYVGITKRGAWKLCDTPDADWEDSSCRPAMLSPDAQRARTCWSWSKGSTGRSGWTWCFPCCTAS